MAGLRGANACARPGAPLEDPRGNAPPDIPGFPEPEHFIDQRRALNEAIQDGSANRDVTIAMLHAMGAPLCVVQATQKIAWKISTLAAVNLWDRKGYCEHGRQRSRCKECGGGSICEHDRVRSVCKECKGGSICEHDRVRSVCKECGGASICEHDRVRSVCKECGGGSLCEHGRRRSRCKDCGGGSLCEHGRRRSRCKECGGGSICEHERVRSHCKECGGSAICEHGTEWSKCKECGGGAICSPQPPAPQPPMHARSAMGGTMPAADPGKATRVLGVRYKRIMKGKAAVGTWTVKGWRCEHDRVRSVCKECGGGSICEHGRVRSQCKECKGGASICAHSMRKSACKECRAVPSESTVPR